MVAAVLLLSGTTAWAQGDKKTTATTTPTQLPGEEKLSAQERAERDFLMPVRRKQAAALRATAEEAGVHQPAVEVTARNLEAPEEDKPATEAAEAKAAPAAVHRTSTRSYHRRSSPGRRRSSVSARGKTTAKKSTAKKKKTTRRR
ncbi:hypothetical protein HNQ93_000329 [Hymenobacter luteus]|uniref:Uncharacterized protein n=2 Tax=Hymenobacter TaxID=89966 RepID=A0A7W9SZ16_9BACT|nr:MULTISPECIES: hypothetical protein [Hymenobacter]MBB4600191.1 hypothetical protein [Hymenobacter latericoloratus]MBB6057499.1 hypothetical protein [Hymenobacter luteus]